eukprot:TRINITY_DN1189_c0_g2_i1.p1 TRINITY_DN1189_c0_g2~~TRINITY_DN1189_c0_g2_i1.p1  ORF type:complete len:427 (-),score=98.53 TRINITY_DN1189_c0_g2_i1:71-1351(-)
MPFRVLLVIVSCLVPFQTVAATATEAAGERGIFRHLRQQSARHESATMVEDASVVAAQEQATSTAEDEGQVADSNGTPHLASVSSVLKSASVTLKSLAVKTNVLKKRLNEVQGQSSKKLSAQRTAFERRLRTQQDGNDALISSNANILNVVNALKKENRALRDAARKLEESNRFKRKVLQTLQSRLKDTRAFFATALNESDDSHASQLVVLGAESNQDSTEKTLSIFQHSVSTQKKVDNEGSQDGEEEEDDEYDDDNVASFLAVSSQVWRNEEGMSAESEAAEALRGVDDEDTAAPVATEEVVPSVSETPEQLLNDLEKGVKSLEAEQNDGEAKLKARFIELFRSGHHKQMEFMSQQKALNKTKESLLLLQKRLQLAEDHLKDTESKLAGMIHNIGVFLRGIAHAALAPAEEATQALRGLSSAVDS